MSAPYKKVLLVGATSGIGHALADKYAATGTHVVAVGRRKEQLDSLAAKHPGKISVKVFDISNLEKIPQFVTEVTAEHPDLGCVFLNSGVQRGFNFTKPETVDLDELDLEWKTNYTSYIHLTKYFLPFLMKQKSSTIMYTTSGLALVTLPRCLNYCATKAALHQFIMGLRVQLENSPVKVIELFPPAVQTELHDAKHQPTIKDGGNIGMPIQEFLDGAWKGIVAGKDEIPVGFVVGALEKIDGPRKEISKHFKWDPSEFENANL